MTGGFWAERNLPFPAYNPTPQATVSHLMISPVNSSSKFVLFLQNAESTLDLTSALLGDPTLESELFAAVSRGVRVRLIAPEIVNGADLSAQQLQYIFVKQVKSCRSSGPRHAPSRNNANTIYARMYSHSR